MTKQITLALTPGDFVKIRAALIGYASQRTDGAKVYRDEPVVKESYTRQANEAIDLLRRVESAYFSSK